MFETVWSSNHYQERISYLLQLRDFVKTMMMTKMILLLQLMTMRMMMMTTTMMMMVCS